MENFLGIPLASVSLWAYYAGLVVYYTLFTAHRIQNRTSRYEVVRVTVVESIVMTLAFVGDTVLPIVFGAAGWPAFASFAAPVWFLPAGIVFWCLSLWLFQRAHADLGRNWSPTLVVRTGQTLVTTGVYGRIRHPVYAAKWLWGLAQALLIPNGVAGLTGLATFALAYFTRVPVEEKMMVEKFGEEYKAYMDRTGRVIPKIR